MRRKNQSGQAIVGTAVAMVVLCGFAGLAIDMGTLRYQKRLQQTAADSAAIAGALNLEFGSGVQAGAVNAAGQNGFTDPNGGTPVSTCTAAGAAVGTVCVQVNNPPSATTDTAHGGDPKYVEVFVSMVQPTYFMQIFGVNSQPVTARAVATNISGGDTCMITLGPPTSAIIGIDAGGNAHIFAKDCGISDNGNLDTTGNSYTIQANTIAVSGQCIGSHCGSPDVQCYSNASPYTCTSIGGAPATQDPMTKPPAITPPAQPPASSSCPDAACNYVSADNSTVAIQPGTYSSITIGKNSNVTMAPGIYYINGATAPNAGLNFSGGGTLTDAANPGVMIYFTNGSTINKAVGGGNNADLNLYPMTTAEDATYAGILFYQDPADTATPYFGGDNNSTYNGTIYMPTATLTFYGNGTETFNGTVISYSVATQGNPIVNFNKTTTGASWLTKPVLVE
jgi:Putative Flp pilus-assembly TadE/G-like